MHSSQSCDSLFSLCESKTAASSAVYSISSMGAASGPTPKSRLGRPPSEGGHRQQAQQQQQQEQRQNQGQALIQQQEQQRGLQAQAESLQQQERGQQQLHAVDLGFPALGSANFDGSGSWGKMQQQQHGFSPHAQQWLSPSMAVEASSGSTRVNSWTFSRADSGISLRSDALGRKLRLHCVTFNMNGKLPASLPHELLGGCGALQGADKVNSPDLLVFATQVSRAWLTSDAGKLQLGRRDIGQACCDAAPLSGSLMLPSDGMKKPAGSCSLIAQVRNLSQMPSPMAASSRLYVCTKQLCCCLPTHMFTGECIHQ